MRLSFGRKLQTLYICLTFQVVGAVTKCMYFTSTGTLILFDNLAMPLSEVELPVCSCPQLL